MDTDNTTDGDLVTMSSSDKLLNLRLEYDKTQEMAIHYDRLNWSIGSILFAGVFVGFGLVRDNFNFYPIFAVLCLWVLLIWRLYYKRHKKIQMVKFKRLQKIEELMGMEQHRNVAQCDKDKKMSGLRGDLLATVLALGVPLIIFCTWVINKYWFS